MSDNDEISLRIAIGNDAHLGKVKNKTLTWGDLRERCFTPVIGQETLREYLELPKPEQDRLKNVGFFLGGPCDDNYRKAANIHERCLVVLDIDTATFDLLDKIEMGLTALSDFEFFAYSTRKHTAIKPRLRVVILLEKPISVEKFVAASRILASKLDPTMDAVDDVSFRIAQLMYWPSHCRDADFFTHHNEGRAVDVDELLADFGDWRDWTNLPFSENQGRKRPTDPGKKAENPHEKTGVIGAFCRAYSIEDAIEKFLPDVYTPGEDAGAKPRYSYVGGSTSNGAIVEDGGLFLYSYHTTDPCSERLVNSFDMVRLHKFGELDKDTAEDTKPTAFPSFKAMVEFLSDDIAVARELQAEQYDPVAMFEDLGDEEDEQKPDSDEPDLDDLIGDSEETKTEKIKADSKWHLLLDITAEGFLKSTVTNSATILTHDPRLVGICEMNQFTREIVTRKPLRSKLAVIPKWQVQDKTNGDLWEDGHDHAVRLLLEAPAGKKKPGYGMKISDRDLRGAVWSAAERTPFHPVRDYLLGLKWDRRQRLDTLFHRFLGVEDNAYTRGVSRLTLLGAVTRVMEPGHKFDFVPILEGTQGKRKSTFINILARHWFAEMEGHFADRKRLVETMQGAWILELPELQGFTRTEVQEIKAFVSATKDKVRLSYARRAMEFPRQCIFIGSTNETEYLKDSTGNRRFWPVLCTVAEIDTDGLAREVDQLWAEAVSVYHDMRAAQPEGVLPLFLSNAEARAEAVRVQESRRIETPEDALAGVIQHWLDTPQHLSKIVGASTAFDDLDADNRLYVRNETCALELWQVCLKREPDGYNEMQARLVGRALRKLSATWECIGTRRTKHYGAQRVYRRKDAVGEFSLVEEDLVG